ncbi:ACR034Wp [Eremothecium gossypii ATCC 10895]|uniref:GPI mannosyltransferase 1 n=1 Tax=Eremothecium gossypii (strain ATCC 10895 / CBS 109.51 / FGSC 9923 / NRRL Y-1056) TaxID=284811 RepID=GPI14_EREGS|nr:ACR034Wp [Eremothecium gossypii ATCC 10895]Q75C82.1 RecName: Full=GPI mannosyltransferase 1; AltName: Full=GPI mannosyltransferase I; Short=GPI-MT-I; AltName: Full=Glycosylphosphatidylinositol-anchor biosynthesis protein 14 [Eremothecium gossypii ATCC 10895]AAS51261.1 ACR034Wp [Eremothecium gossypii ATCC 10895]AEY95552.1 FACR034Wp [Eremothecium gossypii FDAG1]
MKREECLLVLAGLLARVGFFSYGIYQDAHFAVKYTDIDYHVFHDAARYVAQGNSPYLRDTYRYTPLLSWMLVPNHWLQWVHFGKFIFVLFDLLAGVMVMNLLGKCGRRRKLILASLWLLNPVVITVSTRGNAESVMAFLIMWFLVHLRNRQFALSGFVYGVAIHFKIYPIIYALPISIYIRSSEGSRWFLRLLTMGIATLATLVGCGIGMYYIYGWEFLEHAYIYHFTRTDHRHNFSLWNMLLYLDSSGVVPTTINWAEFAFLPQLFICAAVTYVLWEAPTFQNMQCVLFLQTFAFVTYNKVCTSQYFIWYLLFLPSFLLDTTLSGAKGIFLIFLWVGTQAWWLYNGYLLEFEGKNMFYPRLFSACVTFFLANVYLLAQFILDCRRRNYQTNIKKTN